ncbi:hypothetical protein DV738_g2028, partial [Chaetothyriales sp. CBS 135597]
MPAQFSIIFILGPPGAGKGTLGTRLAAENSPMVQHVSVGDLLRRIRNDASHPQAETVASKLSKQELIDPKVLLAEPALVLFFNCAKDIAKQRVADRMEQYKPLECGWRGDEIKCTYCTSPSIKKRYNVIPQQFVPVFNDLLAAARAWDESNADLEHIKKLQANYTKRMEVHIRHIRKASLNQAPANTMEVSMAIFGILSRVADVLDGIHDVMRFQVGSPSIVK